MTQIIALINAAVVFGTVILYGATGEILTEKSGNLNLGVPGIMRAIPILKEAGIDSRVVDLTPHKDPDEFVKAEGFDALNARLEGASSSFMFEAATLAKDYSLSDPQSLTAFEEKLSERLLEIPAELERNNYLEALSRKYGIPSELLRRQVNTLALRGTPAEHYERPKSGTQKREEPGQGILQSQKMMLTYLANYPEAFRETKGLITPEDFTDPLCRSIAEGLYRQQEQGGVNQAQLLNGFADAEAQKQIAGMFHDEPYRLSEILQALSVPGRHRPADAGSRPAGGSPSVCRRGQALQRPDPRRELGTEDGNRYDRGTQFQRHRGENPSDDPDCGSPDGDEDFLDCGSDPE